MVEEGFCFICMLVLDIVLVDVYMLGMSGIELIECVCWFKFNIYIVIVIVVDDVCFFKCLFDVGVLGYFIKGCLVEELLVVVC